MHVVGDWVLACMASPLPIHINPHWQPWALPKSFVQIVLCWFSMVLRGVDYIVGYSGHRVPPGLCSKVGHQCHREDRAMLGELSELSEPFLSQQNVNIAWLFVVSCSFWMWTQLKTSNNRSGALLASCLDVGLILQQIQKCQCLLSHALTRNLVIWGCEAFISKIGIQGSPAV